MYSAAGSDSPSAVSGPSVAVADSEGSAAADVLWSSSGVYAGTVGVTSRLPDEQLASKAAARSIAVLEER